MGSFDPRRSRKTVLRLLVGTSLASGGWIGAGAAQDAGSTIDLETVTVEGSSYTTEGSKSYTTDLISVGEKEARSPREIPQSTTVLTRERIEDGGYTSLDTALRETPGIVVLNNDNGRSSILSRGFEFDSLYFDGLPAPLSSVYGTQPDLAIVDHIEVLRGPSGLFGGTGEPAGAINMALKKAPDEWQGYLEGQYGSWNTGRGEFDIGGPLNDAGTIRGRIVGAFQDGDNMVDVVDNQSGVAYGTVSVDLTEQTTATVILSHLERDITPFNGLPTYADGSLIDIDRSTYTGADWNSFDNNVDDYIAEVEHKFDDGGHARVALRYSVRDADFLYGWAGSAADQNGNVTGIRWIGRDFEEKSLALDAFVSKPFTLFGQEHNVLLGADYRKIDTTLLSASGMIPGTRNLYNWNASAIAEPTVDYTSQTDSDQEQTGIYGQLRIKPIDRMTLIGGGRVSWYDSSTENLLTGATQDEIEFDHHFTPYLGTVVDLTEEISAYASYTEIFQPQTYFDGNGDLLDPREGRQYEAGFKGEFFGGTLNATLAYFNLRDKNRAEQDTGGNYVALGEVEASGIEMEIAGELLPNWQVQAGYTYTQTEYLNGSAAGSVFSPYTPEHQVQLWTDYTFRQADAWYDGLSIGGGVKIYSDFSAVSGSTTIEAPGYEVVDLKFGYEINDNLEAKLQINNLFDEKYYARVGSTSVFNFYGEERNAMLTVKAKF
ncbi:TonB-dependent siderophore receptor [Aurantimonas sp. VKM B-3413]|uniref:TonB-dependent siderophore receptor n=1 Tax=Aurantimonas sp. VKM B-3413 TaxID=2779401 RepID=UPI001E46A062|nr:TonB-dependent siderophore receptor [Aurantimonas sp. VKM B-3413]MCB8839451.1 TonB-dependent siderophore receptor [Aurantimonas sp. VKM B-3413]